jgi:luciferase family oxidoreductase group 1
MILSVLDLSPVVARSTAADAFRRTVDLARHVERWGYRRFWLAEHHGMPGIASAATAVLIGHVAGATSTIRVGAGGIMLPNHSPLVIAEQFGTLESLYPGRIDLGLGRAPGSDQMTSRALRRTLASDADAFPRDVLELLGYFEGTEPVVAVPGAGIQVPIWILGSSLFGAQLAAELGLPYAFASHFAPAQLMRAIDIYRQRFRPSRYLDRPYVMPTLFIVVADSDAEARLIASSLEQSFVASRTGRPIQLPPPVEGYREQLDPFGRAILDDVLSESVVGDPHAVARQLEAFVERTAADELMVATAAYDHATRLRSYELLGMMCGAGGASDRPQPEAGR